MNILEEARRVLEIEIDSIRQVKDKLDSSFLHAVDLLLACKGKVVVSGLGKSGLIGRKIASTLASTGTPAVFLHPSEGLHGDLGVVMRSDVALLISNSGETAEMIQIIPEIKRIHVKIIALTGRPDSTLAQHADVVIDVGVKQEACPNNLAPTASTTTLLAVGDALAVVLLKKRGFREEDFARLHSGGAIGKRLLLQVDELMHTGEANPLTTREASMKQAIIEMTAKGLGAVCVIDGQHKLVGILTDGDLRRAIERFHDNLLEKPVSEIMTHAPVTIPQGSLAVEAIKLMEDRPSQISVLPVVTPDGQPVGLVRLHDLAQAGVF